MCSTNSSLKHTHYQTIIHYAHTTRTHMIHCAHTTRTCRHCAHTTHTHNNINVAPWYINIQQFYRGHTVNPPPLSHFMAGLQKRDKGVRFSECFSFWEDLISRLCYKTHLVPKISIGYISIFPICYSELCSFLIIYMSRSPAISICQINTKIYYFYIKYKKD